ncbi:hypothetical protein RFI_07643, partial [Reticulomyxa filosa]
MEIKTKDMDEIYLFLMNSVQMKEEQATQVWKELRDNQDCLRMEDMLNMDETGWEGVFTNTGLKSSTKSRLRNAISQYKSKMDPKSLTPFYKWSIYSIYVYIMSRRLKKNRQKNEKSEVVLISEVQKTSGSAYVTLKVLLFLFCNTLIFKNDNTRVRVDPNNEKWESVDMQLGDEVKCSYLIDDNGQVVMQSINYPEMYSGQVHVSNREAIIEISPLSAPKEGPQKVSVIIVIFWKYASKSAMEVSPRHGDTLKFRLQFVKNEWHPKKVKLVPHIPPFCVVVATFNKRQMKNIPLSGSAMHALTLFNKDNQAPKNTSSYLSLKLGGGQVEEMPSYLTRVIEECIQCNCGIPIDVLNELKKNKSRQTQAKKKLGQIVQQYQELTEDKENDIKSLLENYQRVISEYKKEDKRNKAHEKKRANMLRIYVVCDSEISEPVISLEDDTYRYALEKIANGIFYKDFKDIQEFVTFNVHQGDSMEQSKIKTDTFIAFHQQSSIPKYEGIILSHLLENVKGSTSFEFASHALKDITQIISEGLAQEQRNIESRILQFEDEQTSLSS